MNNYQKMRETNKMARRELEKLGFEDIVMFGHSRFSHDIYGWDGVCKRLNPYGGFKVYWLQIKSNRMNKRERKKLEDFCAKSGQTGMIIEKIPYQEKRKNGESYTKHKLRISEIG